MHVPKPAVLCLGLILVLLATVLPAEAEPASSPALPSSLKPYDDRPLGQRVPLILVHGINPDPERAYGWSDFLAHSEEVDGFQEYYKTYLFVFDPSRPVMESSEQLREALHGLATVMPSSHPVRIAALSLGGMMVRKALEDEALQNRVDRFIAIGVPFHGSPLANPAWIRAQVRQDSPFSILRLVNHIAYWETRRRFPNFIADYCWDNFDGAIPPRIAQKSPCQATDYGPDRMRVPTVLYAGYFGASSQHQEWLRQYLSMSENRRKSRYRGFNLFSRHMMFRVVQPAISELPVAERPLEDNGHYPPLLAYNDGISPISSQLWLGRFVQAMDELPVPAPVQWEVLAELKGDGNARLFDGLDHRDWLEGKTRHKHEHRLKDLLHPHESRRSIFEWLAEDLSRDTPLVNRQGQTIATPVNP